MDRGEPTMSSGLNLHELVREGIAARRAGDASQWRLGDLALQVETSYGREDLRHYAEAIAVEYSTLKEYRRVASAFAL